MVANRTAQVNQIGGLLGEFGVVPKGVAWLRHEPGILEDAENGLPTLAREVLAGCSTSLMTLTGASRPTTGKSAYSPKPASRRADSCESAIGPQTATALVASMGNPPVYSSGRSYTASLGITPRQHSSGGKERRGQVRLSGSSCAGSCFHQ